MKTYPRLLCFGIAALCAPSLLAAEREDDPMAIKPGVSDEQRPDLANTKALRAQPAKPDPEPTPVVEDPNLPKKISSKRDEARTKIPKMPFTFAIQENGKLRITAVDAEGPFARHFKVNQEVTWDDIDTEKLTKAANQAHAVERSKEKPAAVKAKADKK